MNFIPVDSLNLKGTKKRTHMSKWEGKVGGGGGGVVEGEGGRHDKEFQI